MSNGHGMIVCKVCQKRIGGCRCMDGHTNIIGEGLCDVCKEKPGKPVGMEQEGGAVMGNESNENLVYELITAHSMYKDEPAGPKAEARIPRIERARQAILSRMQTPEQQSYKDRLLALCTGLGFDYPEDVIESSPEVLEKLGAEFHSASKALAKVEEAQKL